MQFQLKKYKIEYIGTHIFNWCNINNDKLLYYILIYKIL